MSNFGADLQNTKNEVSRLATNWQTLLDTMPEMVFLLGGDFVIEYMNRSAKERFNDLCSRDCGDDLRRICEDCSVFLPEKGNEVLQHLSDDLIEAMVKGVPIEYSAVPFAGYTGEQLVMIVMRDVTQRKRHEKEIREFNNNIGEIKYSDPNQSTSINLAGKEGMGQPISTVLLKLSYIF